MKKRISVVIVITLLLNCAYTPRHYISYEKTRPIVISTQVGDVIDLEEREKYGLFQEVADFESATFYGIHGGGYEVKIITENGMLVAVNRDSLAIALLSDYIDRYDEIKKSRAEFEEQWKIVDYDYLGQPITQHEVNRVKRNACCIGGSVGSGVLVAVPSILLIGAKGLGMQENVEGDIVLAVPLFVASIAIGAWLGRKADRSNALKAIKEARKPQIVE